MAIFRKLHTSFWSDSFIAELDNDHKLFYIYLMTNERTKQCGVYEITKRQISFDLGYSIDKVSKLLKYFILKGKIKYNDSTSEIGIGNWLKYNSSTSPKVQSCINSEFKLVKDTLLIDYVKSMNTQTQEEQEEEQEEEYQKKDISQTHLIDIEKIFLEKTESNWTESYAKKEAQKFYNFYGSKGWKVGKEKMKSLPHAIGGWISRCDKPETKDSPKEETEREFRLRTFNERNGL
jgi:hypothetical protein